MLEKYELQKGAVLARYSKIAEAARESSMNSFADEIVHSRLPKIQGDHFHLVILGEFNHGKSTFVNALLGQNVLPTGITPTTAALNHVIYSEEPSARVVKRSGESETISAEAIKDWVTVAGGHGDDVRFVEVGYPAELLKGNITLVDTPGVNDLNEQRAEVTYGYVPRADAVIFLLDAGQALKDSEREFLSSHVIAGAKDRLLFVLGKVDLLSSDERDDVVAYVKKGINEVCPGAAVFPISAKHWLEGKSDESGFPALIDHLRQFLQADRAAIVLDNAATDAIRSGKYVAQNLGVKLHAYELTMSQLQERVAAVEAQLEASKKTLDELHGKIRAESSAIKAQARLDLESFSRYFVDVVPSQIDKVDAEDVKRYLGAFVEDKFKEWSELEGAKIASLLEHLAEDVISVTNENVAAVSEVLATKLSPRDTEVAIDIDSFKYDVGVYAAGALSTTVMLFVNGLAGGLMTLAVPILAIVVKSKVAGDMKEQAKERVPAVVLKAAAAMQPHLEKTVDDFAVRLADFVTTAGNTLFKGIREVLESVVAERRETGGEIGGKRAECEARRDRVLALVAELENLRSDFWSENLRPIGVQVSGENGPAGAAPVSGIEDASEPA